MGTAREGTVNVIRLNKYGWSANDGFVNDYPSNIQNPFYICPPGKVALFYVLKYDDRHPFENGGSVFVGGKFGDLSPTSAASSKAATNIAGPLLGHTTPPDYWVLDEGERVFRQQGLAWTSSHYSFLVFEYNKP